MRRRGAGDHTRRMSQKTARRARVQSPPSVGADRGVPRAWLYGGAGLLAVIVVVAVVLASQLGGDGEAAPAPGAAATSSALLAGIPQDGASLGSPEAPVTLVEYADLQCPFCAEWSRDAFGPLVEEYVRGGKLRIEFRGLAFIGPDSTTALRAAVAAGEQDRLWNVVHDLYASQGGENEGWVTEDLLRGILAGAGLDAEAVLGSLDSDAVTQGIAAAAAAAEASGIDRTPTFQLGPTGGTLELLQVETLDADAFRPSIDGLLGG